MTFIYHFKHILSFNVSSFKEFQIFEWFKNQWSVWADENIQKTINDALKLW